jgi:hypothetical protein
MRRFALKDSIEIHFIILRVVLHFLCIFFNFIQISRNIKENENLKP